MDYLIYADGSYEAIPSIETIPAALDKIDETGAVRLVWRSSLHGNGWHQLVPSDVNGRGKTDDVPDEIKLHAMLV